MGLRKWIEPRSKDERIARQEQLVNVLALGGTAAGLLYLLALVVLLFVPQGRVSIASLAGGALCAVLPLASYLTCRRGHIRSGAVLIVVAAVLVGLYAVFVRGATSVAVVVMTPAALFAGMAIGGRAAVITALVEFVLYLGVAVGQANRWLPPPSVEPSLLTAAALTAIALGLLAVVTWQTMGVMEAFIRRVQERERVLQTLSGEKDRLLAEIQDREQAQGRLLETIRQLGSPVIPLAAGIIAMPLIGAIDDERAGQVVSTLLEGVSTHRARVAIVDITGVPAVDTAVAGALLKAAQGVRLLGATPVLTGIRAEVAQTLVGLGLDLSAIVTRGTLQEGLTYALSIEGKR